MFAIPRRLLVMGISTIPLYLIPGGVVPWGPATWTQSVGGENDGTSALTAKQRESLDEAADYSTRFSGRAVLVMREGAVVYERYDGSWGPNKPHMLASGTKSFTGVVAMFAVQDGLLTLDERVSDTITEWKNDPQKQNITVRHLLTLSSGLHPADAAFPSRGMGGNLLGGLLQDRNQRIARADANEGLSKLATGDWFKDATQVPIKHDPGTVFEYGPSHFYAFGEFLNRKLAKQNEITTKTFESYARSKLFEPIGLSISAWGKDREGNVNMPGGLFLTAREWAKFGQFVLLKGSWEQADGSQISLLKPELLAQCFEPSRTNRAYGLTWWLGGAASEADTGIVSSTSQTSMRDRLKQRALENEADSGIELDGKPLRVHMAAGLGKQRLYVLPEHRLVVVRFAEPSREGRQFSNREFLKPIVDAFPTP